MTSEYYLLNPDHTVRATTDVLEWGKMMQDKSRIVKQEIVTDKNANRFLVSTVFLGLDHNFGKGEPLIFETMVFKLIGENNHRDSSVDEDRYATWQQAEDGHKLIAAKWENHEN